MGIGRAPILPRIHPPESARLRLDPGAPATDGRLAQSKADRQRQCEYSTSRMARGRPQSKKGPRNSFRMQSRASATSSSRTMRTFLPASRFGVHGMVATISAGTAPAVGSTSAHRPCAGQISFRTQCPVLRVMSDTRVGRALPLKHLFSLLPIASSTRERPTYRQFPRRGKASSAIIEGPARRARQVTRCEPRPLTCVAHLWIATTPHAG